MALRATKPTAVKKRLKALFFGPAGVGKTTTAIGFPRPYLIDTERGAENDQYVKSLELAGGVYFHTTDPDDLVREVHSLMTEKHDYQTLIIDPLTIIYDRLIERGMSEKGEEFGRYKTVSDRAIKHLCGLLLRLDMNVIITSHAKAQWVRSKDAKGKEIAVQDGITFDCYPKLDYLFDLVFQVERRGKERVGIVRKTRIESFGDGEVFPFSYDAIADKYGRSMLERNAEPLSLATAEQVAELTRLVEAMKIETATVEKWLDKAEAERFDEMGSEIIQKCIDYCKAKLEGKAA